MAGLRDWKFWICLPVKAFQISWMTLYQNERAEVEKDYQQKV